MERLWCHKELLPFDCLYRNSTVLRRIPGLRTSRIDSFTGEGSLKWNPRLYMGCLTTLWKFIGQRPISRVEIYICETMEQAKVCFEIYFDVDGTVALIGYG